MIVVTGGAGMIGSNIIKALNKNSYTNILVVDNLKNGKKILNLSDLCINQYIDKKNFLTEIIENNKFYSIEAIFHEGACSNSTEWNGKYMMKNNYQYSKKILNYCINNQIPLIYASSASVYGNEIVNCVEERKYERPLTVYAYSKMLFDHYVRQILKKTQSQICGLRYFNVYGPREGHKKNMASMIFQLNAQIINNKKPKLFEKSDKFKRDFIHVDDVVNINLWCWKNKISGIYNCGTGFATSFQEVAKKILEFHKKNLIHYVPFPNELKGIYQTYTKANLKKLRAIGYTKPFKNLTDGILEYLKWLNPIPKNQLKQK